MNGFFDVGQIMKSVSHEEELLDFEFYVVGERKSVQLEASQWRDLEEGNQNKGLFRLRALTEILSNGWHSWCMVLSYDVIT